MKKTEKRAALLSEMKALDELAKKENRALTDDEKKRFDECEAEIRSLDAEIEAETRAGKIANAGETPRSSSETRADEFARTGRMEVRAVLSTGQIARPTRVGGINGLGEVALGIVDDVNAIPLSGAGAWVAAYKEKDAKAGQTTDGETVGGSGADVSTYNYVTISPDEWGVLDEISNQVKKMTPLSYQQAVEDSAVIALREYAANVILSKVLASSLAKTRSSVALDANYVRSIVLGFRSIAGKGNVRLYVSQGDLATLGAVRGTNEKKPVYEIEFDAGTTTSGTLKDGGTAVQFRVLDGLEDGTQLFGQPGTIDMPMWDNYTVSTDEGGDYFKRNVMGIRGIQTANADLAAKHGMHIIKQAAASSGS